MKRIYLLVLVGLLGGCLIITPTPDPPDPVEILAPTFETNVTANGQIAICSNRVTSVSYTFRYTGDLASWSSYVQGNTLGTKVMEQAYSPTASGVEAIGTDGYRTTFLLAENTAPYGADENAAAPKAITVVPVPQPVVIGSSKLHLTVIGQGGDTKSFASQDIPVIENCPAG